jgi:hypothetical protein
VEGYYEKLEAPKKKLIWLNGGHGLAARTLVSFVDVVGQRSAG